MYSISFSSIAAQEMDSGLLAPARSCRYGSTSVSLTPDTLKFWHAWKFEIVASKLSFWLRRGLLDTRNFEMLAPKLSV